MCNIRSLFPRVHIEKKKKRTKLPLLKKSSQLGSKIYRDVLKNHERRKKKKKKNRIDRPRSLLKWTTTYHYYLWWTHTKKWTRRILPSLLNLFSLLDVLLTILLLPLQMCWKTHEAYYSSWLKKIVVGNKPPLFQLEFRNELKHTSKRNLKRSRLI